MCLCSCSAFISVFFCRKARTWRHRKEAGWDAGEPSARKDEWVVVRFKETSIDMTESRRSKNQSVFQQLYHSVAYLNTVYNTSTVTGAELCDHSSLASPVWALNFDVKVLFSLTTSSSLVLFLRLCHSESRKLFPKYRSLIYLHRYVLISSSCSTVTTHFSVLHPAPAL